MKSKNDARHLIFKTCIALGFVLGVVLLWQTISTYVYVSGNMMVQAAEREAGQKRASLQRALRSAGDGPQDGTSLTAILNESTDEWKGQVAWIRVLDTEGRAVASSGTVAKADAGVTWKSDPDIRQTSGGGALVLSYPFALGRSRGMRMEIAVYLDSVSASFASLRQNLIVGVSASLALMGALIILALLFPKYLRGQQVQGQVELARRVQSDLLPSRDTQSPNFDFAAECIP